MSRLDVLQDQWLILTLLGGLTLVLGVVLAYMAMWRRDAQQASAAQTGDAAAGSHRMPLVLLVIFVALGIFAVAYTVSKALNPPNW